MAEPKRLELMPVNSNYTEKDSKKQQHATVRFTLELVDSNETTCPEFSYPDLLKNTRGNGDKPGGDPDDPFGDDEDVGKLEAIARAFEEKYGPKPGSGKQKKKQLDDLLDLGDGYDENDAFIDNSEAYDEIVPSCLTTKLGGFYINSGKLDFREASDASSEEFQVSALKKRKKKRRILTDSESDGGEKKKKIPKKRRLKDCIDADEKKKRRKKILGDGEKSFKRPKRPIDKEKLKRKKMSPTVAELLKQHTDSTSGPNPAMNGVIGDGDAKSPEPMNSAKLDSVIDSVIAMSKDDSDSRELEEDKVAIDPENIPKLPPGIPADLAQTVEKLKQTARESREGKCKFFTNTVNRMLLDVELQARQLPCGQRSTIYGHLAAYLPCSKDTLVKRAKNLRLSEEDDKLREPLQKLKDAINAVMPAMQEKYEVQCREKAARLQEDNKDQKEKEGREEALTESDDEKTNQEGSSKGNRAPRRKFEWTDHLRNLFCDVVTVKMKMYDLTKGRTQTADDHLKSFLDHKVRVLWPKGWMQARMLFKESRAVHAAWTGPQRPKKNVIVTKSANNTPVISQLGRVGGSLAPGSAPAGSTSNSDLNEKASEIVNTPVARGSPTPRRIVPTLLDYATEISSVKAADMPTSSIPVIKPSSTSLPTTASNLSSGSIPGISAKQTEESWNHKVSDILRSSISSPGTGQGKPDSQTVVPNSSPTAMPVPASHGGNTFLAQFQKYATSMHGDRHKDKMTAPSPAAQAQVAQIQQKIIKEQLQKQLASQKKMALQQGPQKSNLLLQTKQLPQQLLLQKLQMSAQQRSDKQVSSASRQPSQSSPQKAENQKSLSQSAQSIISQQVCKQMFGGTPQQAADRVEDTHKQLLKVLQPSGAISLLSGSKPLQSDLLRKKITQASSTPLHSSQVSTLSSTSMRHLPVSSTSMQHLPVSSTSMQLLQPNSVHTHSSSNTARSKQGKVGEQQIGNVASNLNMQSPTSQSLLQTLFANLDSNVRNSPHLQTIQLGTSKAQIKPQVSVSQKSSQPPIWSMTSLVGGASTTSSTSAFSPPYSMPKPVPGYQSVKLTNLLKESPVQATMQITQGHGPISQEPPLTPAGGLPGSFAHSRTSPLSEHQSPLSSPLASQTSPHQHQISDPTRSPHGY